MIGPAEPARESGITLLAFFALTFALTETSFVTAAAMSQRLAPGENFGAGIAALILLGTFMPAFVALALTARAEGREGVRALLARLFIYQVRTRWYVFAIGYIAAIKLVVALGQRALTGRWPRFGALPWYLMLAATILSTVVGGQSGEELGWRGYALPRLASRLGLGAASIVLGAIWACWHLPLFYLKGADTFGQSFPLYLLQVVAFSVAIAWLWWRTNGSLLLVMLMHAAINNTKDIVPSVAMTPGSPFALSTSRVAWVSLALLWACAAWFLADMRGVRGLATPDAARAASGEPAGTA